MQHVSVCWSEHGEEGARLRGNSVCTIMCVFRKLCSFCVQLIRIETKKCFAQHTIPALLSFIRFAFPKSSPATTAWLTLWWLFCSTYLRSGGRLWSLMKKVTLTAAICECRLWCSTKRKRLCICFSQVYFFFVQGRHTVIDHVLLFTLGQSDHLLLRLKYTYITFIIKSFRFNQRLTPTEHEKLLLDAP